MEEQNMVTVTEAAKALGLSRQRIHQIMAAHEDVDFKALGERAGARGTLLLVSLDDLLRVTGQNETEEAGND